MNMNEKELLDDLEGHLHICNKLDAALHRISDNEMIVSQENGKSLIVTVKYHKPAPVGFSTATIKSTSRRTRKDDNP